MGQKLLLGGKKGIVLAIPLPIPCYGYRAMPFLKHPDELQTEAFGTVNLMVVAKDVAQMAQIAAHLEGNLTGCIYSHTEGDDDALYDQIAPILREKVGRLLNDKMPTGVAVVPAMNHGGPFPATGHPWVYRCGYSNLDAQICGPALL